MEITFETAPTCRLDNGHLTAQACLSDAHLSLSLYIADTSLGQTLLYCGHLSTLKPDICIRAHNSNVENSSRE